MDAPDILVEFYNLLVAVRGWIILPLIVIIAIVIMLRGFSMWRKTGGDWQSVIKSLEMVITFLVILVITYSVTSMYDWLRLTPIGGDLPNLQQIENRDSGENQEN